MKSGWCTAPPGARPKCEGCRVEGCGCECHETRMVERDSGVGRVESGLTERAPDRVLGGPQSRALADYEGVDW